MNDLNVYAIGYVRNEIKSHTEILNESSYRKSCEFEFMSYSISALKEILYRLERNKDISPITILEDYIDQMKDYSCEEGKGSEMFLTACDVARYILDEIISWR